MSDSQQHHQDESGPGWSTDPLEPQLVQVRFGPQPFQLLPQPVAERILCAMSKGMPVLFGKLLAEAWIGPEATPAKRGKPPTTS